MKLSKKAFNYGVSLIRHAFHVSANKPQVLSYLITDYCNSHCVSCNAWRSNTNSVIDQDKLGSILRGELFSDILHVGISGGEPSTVQQIKNHIEIIVNALPKIKSISITSNCINSAFWLENLKEICEFCDARNVGFQINISLDGIGRIHDIIRGTKGNFENTKSVISYARDNGIPYQLHTTICKYNVYHIGAILHYAKTIGADIIFRLASEIFRLDNDALIERIALDERQKSFLCDFLLSRDLLGYTKSPGRRLFYRSLVEQILNKTKRKAPCYFKHQGIVLAADGTCSYCSRFVRSFGSIEDDPNVLLANYRNQDLFRDCCNGACDECYHDQTGLWSFKDIVGDAINDKITNIRKVFMLASYSFKAPFYKRVSPTVIESVRDVCIIGMYGGEHVGDAAILGGVIHRLRGRYPGINKVSVYSFRGDRTRSWVDSLELLKGVIDIEVISDEKLFVDIMKDCQLLVWAGGPMMEIPVLLSRNFFFVRKALRFGLRFEIEGVGYGPIKTRYCEYTIDRIIAKASYLSTRSQRDYDAIGDYPSKTNMFLHDPAFDYLDLLSGELFINDREKRAIDRFFSGDHKGIMALNIRPLWDKYGKKDGFSFESFLDEISHLIAQLGEKGVKTVFFPMNADRFGFSDLEVGYCIKDRLKTESCFEVWETEPTINELIFFLRKVDAAICMRFHAVVFALSQSVPTIGIDYSLNGKGKVSTLLDDNCCLSLTRFQSIKVIKLLNKMLALE